MSAYTPRGILAELHSHVWQAIELARKASRLSTMDHRNRWSAQEVEGVLKAVGQEVWKMRELERAKVPKSLNRRQAEEFALNAQLAKVRQATADALKQLQDEQSHK